MNRTYSLNGTMLTVGEGDGSVTIDLESLSAQTLKDLARHADTPSASLSEARDSLSENEELFFKAFHLSPTVMSIFDANNNCYYEVNEKFTESLGYTRDEVIGKSEKELGIYADPEDRKRIIRKAAKEGSVRGEVARFRAKDGSIRWGMVCGTLITLKGRLMALGSVTDITELKTAEEAIRESEARYRALFESANDAIFTMDFDRILQCNPRTAELLERPVGEILGRTPFDFSPEVQADGAPSAEKGRCILEKVMNGSPQSFEWTLCRSDGQTFPAEVSLGRIDAAGRTLIQAMVRDVSERKKLESQLLQAQKMEAIGTLAGGIAHNFNNILTGIQGYASLMRVDLDPAHPHYERLRSIEEQVKNGADLTRQLLGFARGGRFELKPLDMNALLEKTSRMFGQTRREFIISRNLAPDVLPVTADANQMEQVLLNLYMNAWHAMSEGGTLYLQSCMVTIADTQAFSQEVKPGTYVKISLTDTGVGMDEKTLKRIFEPFFTTKELGRGTGLGLATVYGIVKGHGGFINAYSEVGIGTTFNIYLPATPGTVSPVQAAHDESIVRGTGTILLVDDEETVRTTTQEMLDYLGYRVITACDGDEAVALYRDMQGSVDLVVLDMILPGRSGRDTFIALQEINPEVRVILSSGYSLNGQATGIMALGCRAFMQKPFMLPELSRKVRDVIAAP